MMDDWEILEKNDFKGSEKKGNSEASKEAKTSLPMANSFEKIDSTEDDIKALRLQLEAANKRVQTAEVERDAARKQLAELRERNRRISARVRQLEESKLTKVKASRRVGSRRVTTKKCRRKSDKH